MKKKQVCNYVDITQVQYKINNSEEGHSWPPLQDRGVELFRVEKIHHREMCTGTDILCRPPVLPSTESVCGGNSPFSQPVPPLYHFRKVYMNWSSVVRFFRGSLKLLFQGKKGKGNSCIQSGVTPIQALGDVTQMIQLLHIHVQYTTFDLRYSVKKL